MLLIGQSEQTIDAKGRLAIPAKFKSQWDVSKHGKLWVCVPWTGINPCLRIYTQATYEQLAEAYPSSLTPDGVQAQAEARFFGEAEPLEPDAEGRLTLPKRHLERVTLGKEVMVIGARTRMEVHPRSAWLAGDSDEARRTPQTHQTLESLRTPTARL